MTGSPSSGRTPPRRTRRCPHDRPWPGGCPSAISVHVGFFGQWLHQVEYLAEHNLLGPDVTLPHCNATTDHEYELIRRSWAHISLSPESEMHLGCGIPPTGRALRHGLRPSISTDVPSVMGTDMFGQMRSMLCVMRGVQSEAYLAAAGGGRDVLPEHEIRITSHDVLEFATIEGARQTGLDARTGSITPGKQADVIVVSTDAPALQRMINPAAALVLGANPGDVEYVFVAGRAVKRAGRLVGYDLADIRRRAEESATRLLSDAGVDSKNFLVGVQEHLGAST
ncbi:amidohydrolase family protein [Nonomuraea polychroma]|uniref:amidohydrolase family protein n=1 Tax=Nonomuraea polychroma TaxID=46176 RepID=UPI003D8E87AE